MESEHSVPLAAPHWSIDRLVINSKGVFVYGWFFVPGHQVTKLHLVLKPSDGDHAARVILDAARPRHDVFSAFQAHPESLESGFLGAGSLPRPPQEGDRLILSGLLDCGDEIAVEIPASIWNHQLKPAMRSERKAARRLWRYYLRQAMTLLANGKITTLREKVTRQLNSIPAQSLRDAEALEYLNRVKRLPQGDIYFVIDHQLGGGANSYREHQVKQWIESGVTVMTLTFNLAKLQPVLTVEATGICDRFSLEADFDLLSALKSVPLTSITYNTGVSFVGADRIPGLLLGLREHHKAKLCLLIHDYFSICPSHFLLNSEGQFCRVPDLEACRACLPNTSHGFSSLFQGDIAQWRQIWGPLLRNADEIIAFSQSSVELLRRAYESWPDGCNWLQGRRIDVRPHKIDYLHSGPIKVTEPQHLVIGIVGRLSFHKGSRFVQALARTIEEQGASERIWIIGDLEERVNPRIVKQTGPYQREKLGDEILGAGANVMLFPSICPETFSYVTHEIIQLELPLACFDYGAPAERLKTYEKGLVLGSMDPSSVLDGLRQLFRKFYRAQSASDS